MKRIREWFDKLEPHYKRYVMIGVSATVFILIMMIAYSEKKSNDVPIEVKKAKKETVVNFGDKDDDLALRIGLKNEVNDIKELNKQKTKEIEELKQLINNMAQPQTGETVQQVGDLKLSGVPPPPSGQPPYKQMPDEQAKIALPVVIVGGIAKVQGSAPKEVPKQENTKKKWVNFIPAGSILKATLLNGMFAPTMSKASSKPYPALMRIWDLGFLPNEVRKDLSGCFVLGQAYGELSDSRVHVRLETISCISNNEKQVLEKDIKGFVSGDDGKVGIFGEIRANFGKVALTALLAEFLSAAGKSIKSASEVITQNPLGGVTTLTRASEQDMLLAAAGSGLGSAAEMIAEFYLEIMKEMSPVVEVSGRREVEIIISKGVELQTDDFDWEGVKQNEKADINSMFE